MGKTEQQRRRNEQIKIIREIDNQQLQSLGEDVKHSSGMSDSQSLYDETNNDFLNESERIEKLSTPPAK